MNKKGFIIIFKFKEIRKIISNQKFIQKILITVFNFHQLKIILQEEILISFKQHK
jgi:hypothetical protein